jgi:hypothetical protein
LSPSPGMTAVDVGVVDLAEHVGDVFASLR